MLITVQRKTRSIDGTFGDLSLDWNPFTCKTVERTAVQIPAGEYPVEFTWSPRFNMTMALIDVPGREGIRIHIANFPEQLDGCIGVGSSVDPAHDAVGESRVTFNQLNKTLNMQAGLRILIKDIPEGQNA